MTVVSRHTDITTALILIISSAIPYCQTSLGYKKKEKAAGF
jgi:hypothetical protein